MASSTTSSADVRALMKVMRRGSAAEVKTRVKRPQPSSHSPANPSKLSRLETATEAHSAASHARDESSRDIGAVKAAEGKSQLPVGFYDDTLTDLSARGVSVRKEVEKQLKLEEEKLDDFLKSVREEDEVETRREEEDAEENDLEQEVVQMKFVAQLGSLYSKAANLSKETNSSSTFKDGEEISIALNEEERRVKQIKEGFDEDGGEEERIAASVALSFARQRGKNSGNNSSKQKSNALPIADISDCWTNKSLW